MNQHDGPPEEEYYSNAQRPLTPALLIWRLWVFIRDRPRLFQRTDDQPGAKAGQAAESPPLTLGQLAIRLLPAWALLVVILVLAPGLPLRALEGVFQLVRNLTGHTTLVVQPTPTPQWNPQISPIFTPEVEMPFAGHPVIGTHWALARLGRVTLHAPVTTVRFELNVGVRAAALHVEGTAVMRVVMDHMAPEFGATATPEQIALLARGLGIDAGAITATGWPVQAISTGVRQLFVPVRTLADVQQLSTKRQDTSALSEALAAIDTSHVVGPCDRALIVVLPCGLAPVEAAVATNEKSCPYQARTYNDPCQRWASRDNIGVRRRDVDARLLTLRQL